ncbi:protein phosphatase Slingshot isoform X2 [Ctenocephalides felis]|uniref:protein phosphatase Slingshot isoform X2 n=1 Tax=Ctenocephalides felis TaxID=7515 RepID=UPI000E6E170D|nr:protein phosphatase Slingshot isoform X2 [Ctenocephalides felis]
MALVTVQRASKITNCCKNEPNAKEVKKASNKSLNENYFAGKGTAVVLPTSSRPVCRSLHLNAYPPPAHLQTPLLHLPSSEIQHHLQSMCCLLEPEDTLKMAVKLESVHCGRTRYLVVVSNGDQSCLLGIDYGLVTAIGLVLPVLADTTITLDGDGGFKVRICNCQHIFKPVSVQAMWSALQTLHRVSAIARKNNFYPGGLSHKWVKNYESRIHSDRSCLNEWHAMDALESRRPLSPDSLRAKPSERTETECIIRSKLKEIMMSVDLDEVTSKYIRTRLEDDLDTDLGEYKPFIDQEMIVILGQMDAPTEVFENVFLGSEWNASNLEELQKNGIRHILNVTREIDNFFPGMFDYLNIRVYDDDNTNLLKYWDDTYKYISRASRSGSKVLVHCKMGISRSASVIVAYAMKAYDWDLTQALKHVKNKRNCIKPNTNFVSQLETYQGILYAMKNREKLQRSKSETNLEKKMILLGGEPTPLVQALEKEKYASVKTLFNSRPKSWSLCNDAEEPSHLKSITLSLDDVTQKKNIILPCKNGKVYSVSQNRIMHLERKSETEPSKVKNIVCEFETQNKSMARKLMWDPGPNLDCSDSSESCVQNENKKKAKQKLKSYLTRNSWNALNGVVDDSIYTILYRHNTLDSENNKLPSDMCFGPCDTTLCNKNVKCKRFKLEFGYDDKLMSPVDINIICPKPYQNSFCDIQSTNKPYKLRNTASEMFYTSVIRENVLLRSKNFSSISVSLIDSIKPFKPFGLVKNLKLEYESKTVKNNFCKKSFSKTDKKARAEAKTEDLSVKYLVGKYENTNQEISSQYIINKNKENLRKNYGAPVFTCSTNLIDSSFCSLPIIKKNQTKHKVQLHHGKVHCLSRLTLIRSNNNSNTCNTMLHLH